MRQVGLFGLSEHLKRLSAYGDRLEVLVLAAQNTVGDARIDYLIRAA